MIREYISQADRSKLNKITNATSSTLYSLMVGTGIAEEYEARLREDGEEFVHKEIKKMAEDELERRARSVRTVGGQEHTFYEPPNGQYGQLI